MQAKFYVYEHWRPDTDMPFYVGKGCGGRAKESGRNKHHTNVVAKLACQGMCFEVRLVHEGLTEQEAFTLEIERIAFWRVLGVRLVNQNGGGKGGQTPSDEVRAKMSASLKGRKLSEAHRAKMSASLKGRKFSEAACAKLSVANKGRTLSEATRAKMSAAGKGRKLSEATRVKIGLANKVRKISEETREKMRAAHKGKKHSKATCVKMSAARKAYFAAKQERV
jgi:hypothetical protein